MWKKDDDAPPPQVLGPTPPPPKSPPPPRETVVAPREQTAGPVRTAVIGPCLTVEGNFGGTEDLLVEGTVSGNIDLKQNSVTVGKTGKVNADIKARVIRVEGEVQGNLVGLDTIIVTKSGQVTGNVSAPRLSLEDGAYLQGQVSTQRAAADAAKNAANANQPKVDASKNGAPKPRRPDEAPGASI